MRAQTRILFTNYLATIATLNSVASATEQFTVVPTTQQTLESKIQESSEFLLKINIIPVDEMSGSKVGLGVGTPIAGRTNTDNADRQITDPTGLDERGYICVKINYDTHVKYILLDTWAKFPDFQVRIRDQIVKRQALDRIMIGWNGTHAAADTDKTAYPLLQDVAVGWLQHMRVDAPAQVMGSHQTAGATVADPIIVGPGGTYANLDALVYDGVELLAPWHREDTALVAICGRKLLHDKYFPVINQDLKPTETLAADIVMSQKRIGGLPAVRVPFFPDNGVLITTLDNLSIYYQASARRRMVKDKPERDRIENYESSNDAYVVEDLTKAAFYENISLVSAEVEG